ncbi:hypothetical protein B7P43_G07094 [Cryptotermes secundus]|nr:hypothetical protein B7P43_G07094 [Cryptotermes secundus]
MLKIPTQRVIEHRPELPDKIRRGLTPKKQHEIVSLAALISAECSAYGITQVLDMGAGLGYLGQLLHHCYGFHVLGLEVEAERVKTASRRQESMCPSSAVKYLTFSISSESCHFIENEIQNSMRGISNCKCGALKIQSHEYGIMNKWHSPDVCIGGGEQCSVDMSDYNSEVVNGSTYVCSKEPADEERMFSPSLGSDNCLLGPSTTSLCMTGLHTCGDLSVDAIRLFFQLVSTKLLVMVPCCYHKMSLTKDTAMTEEKFFNFPLSSSLCHLIHSSTFCDSSRFLRRPFLRLASQETATRWQQWSEEDHKEHSLQVMARAVLQLYAHDEDLVLKKKCRRAVRKTSRSTFDSFMDDALKRYRFVSKTSENHYDHSTSLCKVSELWNHHKASCHLAEIVTGLQMAVQGVAESFILADRAAYLQEHAVPSVEIVKVMNDCVSPRCLALVARK